MCLDIVTKRRLNQKEKQGEGWKVFEVSSDGNLHFMYYALDGPNGIKYRVPRGRWLKAKRSKTYKYLSGFHVYVNIPPLNTHNYLAVKVKYRNARLIGAELGNTVIVADEIFVPREIQSKKSPKTSAYTW